MIKHIVMWKIKDSHEGMGRDELVARLRRELEALADSVSQIRRIEVGGNFNQSAASFDVALYSEFESREDLEIYQKHPEHLKVARFVGEIRTDRAVVDYET